MPPPAPVRRAALVGAVLAIVVFAAIASGGAPSGLVERGPYTADFFDAQAHALLDGRLDVDPDVATIEGFEHDGRTYLYFGIVPSLLRLPVAAVTDSLDGRLTIPSMLLALAVALWATTQLVWRARAWQRGDDGSLRRWEPAAVGLFVAAVGLASPLLFLSARGLVYHEVELWGTATTLVALHHLLRWWDEPSPARLAAASVAAAVAFNTRASVGGGAVAALALVLGLALLWQRLPWRRLPIVAAAVLLPVASYAAVNQARFDSFFSVPFEEQVLSGTDANRRATLEATDGSLFGLEFAPSALATYLRPDGAALQRLFPWITFRETDTIIGDPVFDTTDRSASLPVVAPVLLVLGAVGVVALVRRRDRDPWLPATVGAAAGLASTVTIAFIAHRYLADFTPTLVLPAAIGLWVTGDALARATPARRRLGGAGLAVLAAGSTLASTALAVQAQGLLLLPQESDRRGFVGLQYDIDGVFGDGPPVDVAAVATPPEGPERAADARRGHIELVGECRGLYWFDGREWWPLELGVDLGVRIDAPVERGVTTLLTGDGWSVVVERDGDDATFAYETAAGDRRAWPSVDVDDTDAHEIVITRDPVHAELLVTLDGTAALRAWPVALPGDLRAGPGLEARPAPTPLCDQLAARLRP